MFEYRKKFEINEHEFVDFVRLLGRSGLKFSFGDIYELPDENKPDRKERFRCFIIRGTRKQLNEFLEARDIIAEYNRH